MAKYADQTTEAMVGDVIEFLEPYASRSLQDEVVHISATGAVLVKHRANKRFSSSRMILVSRAPSPEPEQPKVNGEQSLPLIDFVNHPQHYAGLSPEPVDVIEAWQLEWHEGNALKYIARAKSKGERVQDLRKAAWYLNRKAEMLEKNYNQPME